MTPIETHCRRHDARDGSANGSTPDVLDDLPHQASGKLAKDRLRYQNGSTTLPTEKKEQG